MKKEAAPGKDELSLLIHVYSTISRGIGDGLEEWVEICDNFG